MKRNTEMKITIFTPTYRSTATLRRSFESLRSQKYENFEWIVVDDFSDDNNETINLIEDLKRDAPFPVKTFYFLENHFGGKSMEKALELAEGELFALLDHDDEYTSDALEKISALAENYMEDENIGGFVGRCKDETYKMIGEPFPKDLTVDYEGHLRYTTGIFDEFITFFKSDIVRKYVGIMKKGFTYGVLMAKISEYHKMVFINKVFRIYDTAIPTSYTNSKTQKTRFPKELAEKNLIVFDIYYKYFKFMPMLTLKQFIHTNYLISKYNINYSEIEPKQSIVRNLMLITKPLGLLQKVISK